MGVLMGSSAGVLGLGVDVDAAPAAVDDPAAERGVPARESLNGFALF